VKQADEKRFVYETIRGEYTASLIGKSKSLGLFDAEVSLPMKFAGNGY